VIDAFTFALTVSNTNKSREVSVLSQPFSSYVSPAYIAMNLSTSDARPKLHNGAKVARRRPANTLA